MLGKLIKYELKATARTFLPIYCALIVTAIISNIFNRFSTADTGFLSKVMNISNVVMFGLFVALAVITLMVIVQRFYKNLIKDEGYLMFTLPVDSKQIVISKAIITLFWNICSVVVAFITFSILFSKYLLLDDIKYLFEAIKVDILPFIPAGTILLILLTGIIAYGASIFMIYLAIVIGQLPVFNKFRVAASFIGFFVLNTLINQVSIIPVGGMLKLVNTSAAVGDVIFKTSLILCVWQAIIAIALFVTINYILSNHLNLE